MTRGKRRVVGLGAAIALCCALGSYEAARAQVRVTPVVDARSETDILSLGERVQTAAGSVCSTSDDCDDGQACTADVCSNGTCLQLPIPDCIPCNAGYLCAPVEIVFVMDTSGSMRDEAVALCASIDQLVVDLHELGIEVHPYLYGITQTPGGEFDCLTGHVAGLFPGTVPGDPSVCPFPNTMSAYESWGPATAIVAQRFNWAPSSTKIIVPLSDEGPCDGSRPEGCADPGSDRNSITNAINVATANGVIVSPVAGTGSDSCVLNLGIALANGTGGTALESTNPKIDLSDVITQVILNRCSMDDHCDDQHACTTNDRCLGGVCVGTPVGDCEPCLSSATCSDNDACTLDECAEGVCRYAANYDESTLCCNPLSGESTPIDDGDPCTADGCDRFSGVVTHLPAPAGIVCDDQKRCRVNDRCDGHGRCLGTDVGSLSCQTDADCFGAYCDTHSSRCVCTDTPEICLAAVSSPGSLPNPSCFDVGGDIFVDMQLGGSSRLIVGGQFLIGFDPDLLEFVDVEPGAFVDPGSPFETELLRAVNQNEGTVFYAVGVSVGRTGTHGPVVLARLRFRALQDCSSDELCFLNQNPRRTILTDDLGRQVPYTTCCTGGLVFHDTDPVLVCPNSRSVNADAGTLSAMVAWPAPQASGLCEGPLLFSCSGSNNYGADVAQLVSTGGRMPAGISEFECRAVDACGVSMTCAWNVEVRPINTVQVSVQLSPVVSQGPIRRCITFEFFTSCDEEPIVVERTLEFGRPFNFSGFAQNVEMELPAGYYECVVARDPKHTLRSLADMQMVGADYRAALVGDPRLGGHWLIGGDLDDNNVIDGFDEALFQNQYLLTLSPHTPCGTPGIHADLDGDGTVNTNDLALIQRNFQKVGATNCCGTTAGGESSGDVSSLIPDPGSGLEPEAFEASKPLPSRFVNPR